MPNIRRTILFSLLFACGFALTTTQAKAWDGHPPAVSPAIAPGIPGAPGQEGRSFIVRETDFPCLNKGNVIVLKIRVEVGKAAKITSTGGSLALSLLGTGVGGGLNKTIVLPNLPEDEFDRQFSLARADTIISCEALVSNPLREQELNWALRTQRVIRRGTVDGMATTHALQQAYNALERANPDHPKLLPAARAAAAEGRYEEAIRLLTTH